MLGLSPENSVEKSLPPGPWTCLERDPLPKANVMMRNLLLAILVIFLILMFLPWVQNIQAKGNVTTLDPAHRPQTIQSIIAGRIEEWYVREGELVQAGDTIVRLSEVKTEYFDPLLVQRTTKRVAAKSDAIVAYQQKAEALSEQIQAMQQELRLKREQLAAKVTQSQLKIASLEAELAQSQLAEDIARRQFNRTDTLFRQGIKSRTDWEDKRNKWQEAQAKLVTTNNKLGEARQALQVAELDLRNVLNEYTNKIAKAQSDRFSTLSDLAAAQGELNKLEIEAANYATRSNFYFIIAPQKSYVTKAVKPGIGETVKEGDPIVTIMPADFELAVEMYVRPRDLPLIRIGEKVNFIFDGWPAIVFTGWPDLSFGTYSGQIVAIDNTMSPKGYRILVAPNPNDRPWPKALRPDSGARGIALLGTVPVWYELWRQLNGFPPDYYGSEEQEEPVLDSKQKAPLKSVK
ncbi:MAG: HlyD family efflux transporter periplasmic adaptor subunit [Bacteroidetes bacterium]|nr:MAG: HlyD family efflux transporter periplasmic adaptor subunit [Bacteroidota bacterium]